MLSVLACSFARSQATAKAGESALPPSVSLERMWEELIPCELDHGKAATIFKKAKARAEPACLPACLLAFSPCSLASKAWIMW